MQVIMIARLNAMYQRRKMFTFLVLTFLAKTIASGVISVLDSGHISGGELTNNLNISSSWDEFQKNSFCPISIGAVTKEWTYL